MLKVLTVIGTRPEAIKMAPVIERLIQQPELDARLCITAQHRDMIDQVLKLFKLKPDYDLNLMRPGQSLNELAASILQALNPVLIEFQPDWVLVQGDTTTAAMAALGAFYHGSQIGHVEAGLRTGNRYAPWPEEINRVLISDLGNLHFAPTEQAAKHLYAENVPSVTVKITGNTVIDALLKTVNTIQTEPNLRQPLEAQFHFIDDDKPLVLVTGHRRENFGEGIGNICEAIRELALKHHVQCIYPVHLNPNVHAPVMEKLKDVPHVHLIEPLEYLPFVYLMSRADLILTDSGGVQEEAPSLGKPVLVMRETTERPEAVIAGTVKLVGTDQQRIVSEITELLKNATAYETMSRRHNPYGDGKAAARIVDHLLTYSLVGKRQHHGV